MSITLLRGDCRDLLATLEPASVQTIVTSPPYWRLRRYTDDPREIGQEPTPGAYAAALVEVFEACRRVLRDDGTLWVNLGTAYAGSSMTGGTSSKEGSAKRIGRMFDKKRQVGPAVMSGAYDTFALRDDLTPDEIAYVLRELAASMDQGHEVGIPDISVSVDQAIAPLADSEKV